ncbi:hypothetical protein EDD85DRAFT_786406 [Armillaria nabsnona]|nr:hypothetical protein EDD85DRAFT_786406 [Armillaria nabsnona]
MSMHMCLLCAVSVLNLLSIKAMTPQKMSIVPNGGEVVFIGYQSLPSCGMVEKMQVSVQSAANQSLDDPMLAHRGTHQGHQQREEFTVDMMEEIVEANRLKFHVRSVNIV